MDATQATQTEISTRRRVVEIVVIFGGSLLVIFLLSSLSVLIYTSGSRDPVTHVIEVPQGSAELIEQGLNPLEIPPTWSFLADDTLVIDNRDDVEQILGNWVVPPNTVRAFELQPAYGGFFTCSLHPAGAITLDIQARDYDFKIIAAPVFGFGFAVGLIIWIGLTVRRAMGKEPDLSEYLNEEGKLLPRDDASAYQGFKTDR